MNNIPTMLTIRETAQRSGLAVHYVRKLCLREKVCAVRAGKKYLLNFEKFIEYLNQGERKQPQADTSISRLDVTN